jgi:hypothetical protein
MKLEPADFASLAQASRRALIQDPNDRIYTALAHNFNN